MLDLIATERGDMLLLAGVYHPTVSGNPWHDPKSGKFANAPPGVKLLQGLKDMAGTDGNTKQFIEKRRQLTKPDAMAVGNVGQGNIRVLMFKEGAKVDDFTVAQRLGDVGKAPQRPTSGAPGRGSGVTPAPAGRDLGAEAKSATEKDAEVHDAVSALTSLYGHDGNTEPPPDTLAADAFPKRITQAWLDQTLPGLNAEQAAELINRLKASGWTEKKGSLDDRVIAKLHPDVRNELMRRGHIYKDADYIKADHERAREQKKTRDAAKAAQDEEDRRIAARFLDHMDAARYDEMQAQDGFQQRSRQLPARANQLPRTSDYAQSREALRSMLADGKGAEGEDWVDFVHTVVADAGVPSHRSAFIGEVRVKDLKMKARGVAYWAGVIGLHQDYVGEDLATLHSTAFRRWDESHRRALHTVVHESHHLAMGPSARIEDVKPEYDRGNEQGMLEEAMTESLARWTTAKLLGQHHADGGYHIEDVLHSPNSDSYQAQVREMHKMFLAPAVEGLEKKYKLSHADASDAAMAHLQGIHSNVGPYEERLAEMDRYLEQLGMRPLSVYAAGTQHKLSAEEMQHAKPKKTAGYISPEQEAEYQAYLRAKREGRYGPGTRGEVTPKDLEKPWQKPPPPKGLRRGKGLRGGYSSDKAAGTNTALGREGEAAFKRFLGSDAEVLHPPGKGEQSPLDIRFDGYGFEVKSVSTDSTEFKATPKKHEIEEKLAHAKQLGVKPALAIAVIDRDSNRAHFYYRDGMKGGRLSERTGWKYLGATPLVTYQHKHDAELEQLKVQRYLADPLGRLLQTGPELPGTGEHRVERNPSQSPSSLSHEIMWWQDEKVKHAMESWKLADDALFNAHEGYAEHLAVARDGQGRVIGVGTYSTHDERYGGQVMRTHVKGGSVGGIHGGGFSVFREILKHAAENDQGLKFDSTTASNALYNKLGIPDGAANGFGGHQHELSAEQVKALLADSRALARADLMSGGPLEYAPGQQTYEERSREFDQKVHELAALRLADDLAKLGNKSDRGRVIVHPDNVAKFLEGHPYGAVLYHGTPRSNISSIEATGLRGQSEHMGMQGKSVVFLTTDPSIAKGHGTAVPVAAGFDHPLIMGNDESLGDALKRVGATSTDEFDAIIKPAARGSFTVTSFQPAEDLRVVTPEAHVDTKSLDTAEVKFNAAGHVNQHTLGEYARIAAGEPDTAETHSTTLEDGTRQYSAERQRLHQEIIQHFLEGLHTSASPRVLFSGGGYSAGKGGVVKQAKAEHFKGSEPLVIDPDRIKAMLPEFQARYADDPTANAVVYREAWDISQEMQRQALERKLDMIVDGVGNTSPDEMIGRIQQFLDKGYSAKAVYVSVPTAEAEKRAAARAKTATDIADRRMIPSLILRAVHRDVSATVPEMVSRIHKQGLSVDVEVHDNNQGVDEAGKFRPAKRIFSYDSTTGEETVHDERLWREFKDKAHERL